MAKYRDEEDFRELGAYLEAAREALIKAEVKALNMYPPRKGPGKRIERQYRWLDELRFDLDNTWIHDVNGSEHVPGPEPFFAARNHFESSRDLERALGGVAAEAKQYRAERDEWTT